MSRSRGGSAIPYCRSAEAEAVAEVEAAEAVYAGGSSAMPYCAGFG